MKLVAAKCPCCGANIDVDKDSDTTKCEFCRSKIFVDEAIEKVNIEVSGSIEIKNLPKYENYVKLADRYYSSLMLSEAKREYSKALEFDPNNIKLGFREKICSVCISKIQKMDEELIDDAFKEVQNVIDDRTELSQYAKECSNALAYIINKTIEYYQQNNLDYSEVIGVHYKIYSCAISIWYYKNFVNDNAEIKLMILDHYISAMHLLTQDLNYKVIGTRKKSTYKIPYSEKKKYVNNMKKAKQERFLLIKGDKTLLEKSKLYIPNTNYFSSEMKILFLVLLFVANVIMVGVSFSYSAYLAGTLSIIVAFFQLLLMVKNEKNKYAIKSLNKMSCIVLLIIIILFAITFKSTPKYVGKWKNENLNVILNKDTAALKFTNSDTIISGKYIKTCNEEDECIIEIGGYTFEYANNTLCYMKNDYCAQELTKTNENIELPIEKKEDICSSEDTITCSEKNYYVCGDGTEHKENICDYKSEKESEKNAELIVSTIFALCLVTFVGWATNWRRR